MIARRPNDEALTITIELSGILAVLAAPRQSAEDRYERVLLASSQQLVYLLGRTAE